LVQWNLFPNSLSNEAKSGRKLESIDELILQKVLTYKQDSIHKVASDDHLCIRRR
jgi:hypothetical protein